MRDVGIPNGIAALGYGEGDIPALVEGTLKQPRLLSGSPRSRRLHGHRRDSSRLASLLVAAAAPGPLIRDGYASWRIG